MNNQQTLIFYEPENKLLFKDLVLVNTNNPPILKHGRPTFGNELNLTEEQLRERKCIIARQHYWKKVGRDPSDKIPGRPGRPTKGNELTDEERLRRKRERAREYSKKRYQAIKEASKTS